VAAWDGDDRQTGRQADKEGRGRARPRESIGSKHRECRKGRERMGKEGNVLYCSGMEAIDEGQGRMATRGGQDKRGKDGQYRKVV
jgi:hypothetical protein